MNLKKKAYLTLTLWFVGGSVLGLSLLYVSNFFVIPLGLLFGGIGVYIVFGLRCPNCGKSVFNNPTSLMGTVFWIWTLRVPDRCTKCGASLIEN